MRSLIKYPPWNKFTTKSPSMILKFKPALKFKPKIGAFKLMFKKFR